MTNEELKKKICDIIAPYVSAYGDDERIADALIVAGIGDVSDIRSLADNVMLSVIAHKAEVSSMEQRVKEAEHRAEVAERALFSLVHEMYEHDIRPMCDEKFFIESRLIEAEKEIAEERKDD